MLDARCSMLDARRGFGGGVRFGGGADAPQVARCKDDLLERRREQRHHVLQRIADRQDGVRREGLADVAVVNRPLTGSAEFAELLNNEFRSTR